MGTLRSPDGTIILLRPEHLLGRSRSMHTRISDSAVSSQHAAITWTQQGWVIRDLSSRNGTWLGSARLGSGDRSALTEGAAIVLGSHAQVFTVTSIAPPQPTAVRGGTLVEGAGGMLAFPSPDDPDVIVEQVGALGWMLFRDDTSVAVEDGERVVLGGEEWTLMLPEQIAFTQQATAAPQAPGAVAMDFSVSADEEYVELTVTVGGTPHTLKPRAHHYVLLTLARASLDDAGASPAEQGWLYTTELTKMLRIKRNQLYVSLHRARKELEKLGISDATQVIERRATTQQLRLRAALTVTAL